MKWGKRLCICGHKTWQHDVPTAIGRRCLLCSCIDFKYEKRNPAAVALGKLGGKVKSEAKAAAARENGKKGGRPAKAKIG